MSLDLLGTSEGGIMILELCKRLNSIDSDFKITVKYNGNQITLGIDSDTMGSIYSYTCCDVSEAYAKANEFLECLKDPKKFDRLLEDILEVALEV